MNLSLMACQHKDLEVYFPQSAIYLTPVMSDFIRRFARHHAETSIAVRLPPLCQKSGTPSLLASVSSDRFGQKLSGRSPTRRSGSQDQRKYCCQKAEEPLRERHDRNIVVLAVLNALRASMTPRILSDYEPRPAGDSRFGR